MKYINLIQQPKIFFAIGIVLTAIAAFGLFSFRLNFGPDYSDAKVIQIEVTEEISTNELENIITDNYQAPSKIERDSSNIFNIYFQNISQDKLEEAIETVGEKVDISDEAVSFHYEPIRVIGIQDRAVNIFMITTSAFVLYLILSVKGISLDYLKTTSLVISDLLILAWSLVTLLGITSIFGEWGMYMDDWFIATLLMVVDVLLLLFIFDDLRFIDFSKTNKINALSDSWREMIKRDWPTTVLVVTVSSLLSIIPFAVLGYPLDWITLIMLIVSLLGLFNLFVCKVYVLKLVESSLNKIKPLKNILNKQW